MIAYNPKIVTDGLVRCVDVSNIKSYSGSGSTLVDLTNTFNNTIYGGTYGTYDGVQALDFAGTYGSSSRIAAGATGIVATSFTVDVWCRSTDSDRANGTEGRVIANTFHYMGSSTSKSTGWILGTQWTATYFSFEVHDGVGNYKAVYLPDGFYTNYLNKWTNIVGVFSSGSFIKIYQDGALKNTTATTITTLNEQNDPLMWARRSANDQSNWKGQFASGKYYNRALSGAEVAQNFAATRGRFGL